MTVKVSKPAINVRSELSELRKPSGTAGEAMLRAETPQEQQELIGVGRRNFVYNPQMQVAQRGTSSTGITSSGYYTVDRWAYYHGGTLGSLAWTQSQSSDTPAGFSNSLKMECTTAATFGSSHNAYVRQFFEGQDLQSLAYGTPSAKPISISFWVKSNVVGDYTLSLYQQDNPRTNGKTYTVNSPDTWEYKTLTIQGDTGGNGLDNDNNTSMQIAFFLTAGDNQTAGPFVDGTWASYTAAIYATPNQVNVGESVGDYWQITGVQLEIGKVATPFEHRSYGEELALCQRYYETGTHKSRGYAQDTGSGYCQRNMPDVFKVTKRANPTVSISGEGSLGSDVDLDRVTFSTYTANLGNAFTVHDYTWTADSEL